MVSFCTSPGSLTELLVGSEPAAAAVVVVVVGGERTTEVDSGCFYSTSG